MAVNIKNLYFAYDENTILSDVNINIKKNDFIGIIGPNGGGKTTLLKLIAGLLKPTEGNILLFGRAPKSCVKKIGYVPQNAYINKDFPISVSEVLLSGAISKSSFWGIYPKEIKTRAMDLLEKIGLGGFAHKPFSRLSGGETQKVLIARALLNDPDLLVLDEPTANIDSKTEKKIFDLLLHYRNKKTILMVTHDLKTIIHAVKNVLIVEKKVKKCQTKEICAHFALGVYHKPLLEKES